MPGPNTAPVNAQPITTEAREPVVRGVAIADSSEGSTDSGPARPRLNRRANKNKKGGFESLQDVIFDSMQETQRLHRTSLQSKNDHSTTSSVFLDTMKDIKSVASGTIASIKNWANNGTHFNQESTEPQKEDNEHEINFLPNSPIQALFHETIGEPDTVTLESYGTVAQSQTHKNTLLQDLAWPFAACGIDVPGELPKRNDFAPHIHKMKEAVSRAVGSDINNAANDIWKFAAGSRDDDDNTVGTLDTLQEENNQIRRLGSWGTVNTAGTSGTADTGFNSLEPNKTPLEIRFGIEDDDGNTIDPVLLQKTQKSRERRIPRREKIVKFDYPPIKSLRQCPRPDPEDLADLFFTEGELDQIEDDRYCTMSTDDIEIVAVSSGAEVEQPKTKPKGTPTKTKQGPTFANSPTGHHPSTTRDQPEVGLKQTRSRTSTPYRRRHEDDEEADFPTHQSKSPTGNGRLVTGVQIFLRERSTGA